MPDVVALCEAWNKAIASPTGILPGSPAEGVDEHDHGHRIWVDLKQSADYVRQELDQIAQALGQPLDRIWVGSPDTEVGTGAVNIMVDDGHLSGASVPYPAEQSQTLPRGTIPLGLTLDGSDPVAWTAWWNGRTDSGAVMGPGRAYSGAVVGRDDSDTADLYRLLVAGLRGTGKVATVAVDAGTGKRVAGVAEGASLCVSLKPDTLIARLAELAHARAADQVMMGRSATDPLMAKPLIMVLIEDAPAYFGQAEWPTLWQWADLIPALRDVGVGIIARAPELLQEACQHQALGDALSAENLVVMGDLNTAGVKLRHPELVRPAGSQIPHGVGRLAGDDPWPFRTYDLAADITATAAAPSRLAKLTYREPPLPRAEQRLLTAVS